MIVLDTHILIWWIDKPEKLSPNAQKIIEKATNKQEAIVSSISTWEIYLLMKRGKLELSQDIDIWIHNIEKLPYIQFLPVDNTIAAKSVYLPEPLHKDPADRIIIATALIQGATIITSDHKILKYPHVQSIW